jgi:hypothetical protein
MKVLKKIKFNYIHLIAIASIIIISILVICNLPKNANYSLSEKISEYANQHGITIEDVQKNKTLMEQFEMESRQEEQLQHLQQDITVTADEMENYRNMIGNSMDKKKAIFILFNTQDECQEFIDAHGSDSNPHAYGIGTIPLMQNEDNETYYNVVGNENLEMIFDSLKDGEYTKEPFLYSGMYCYLKRFGIDSPISNDKKLIELIKSEKAHAHLQNQYDK